MGLRKLLYLPHIVNGREARLLLFLAVVVLASGGGVALRLYWKVTEPAPQIAKSYSEGVLKEPRAINPLFASQDADRDLQQLVFSGLFTYSGQGELEPDLAEKLEVREDKIYLVTLKKHAFWHDGRPVGADDVVFTVKTIQNPQYKSILRANWQGVAVEKMDEHTVRFELRSPYAPFVENLTTKIIPKHLWENIPPEQALLHELNLRPVGSGPYKFDGMKQEKDGSILWYRLVRNPKYHREGPYIKKITFHFFKNEEDALTAWRRGLIDGFGPVSAARLPELDLKKSSLYTLRMPRIFGIFFNDKKSDVLSEKKVREALAHALDKKEIARKAAYGGAAPLDFPLPFLGLGGEDPPPYSYDPEKAKKILADAGWKDEDGDGVLEKKSRRQGKATTTPLRLTLVTSDWPDLLRAAGTIKSGLKTVGAEVLIEKHSFAELESNVIRPRNFEMLLFGQVYGYEPDPFAFWHSSQIKDPGLNIALYSNKKVDGVLEAARKTFDPAERKKKYEEFSRLLSGDLPAIFLYSQFYLYILPSDLAGVDLTKISLPSDRFNEVNKWYRATKRVFK